MWKLALAKQGIRPLVLIGNTGNLGSAICTNNEFERKGFKIVAAFDNDPQSCGKPLGNISKIEHIDSMKQVIKDVGAKIAILAVSGAEVQAMTSLMVDAGISTILNYSPETNLHVPNHVNVLDMDAPSNLLSRGGTNDPSNAAMPYTSSLEVLGPLFSNPTPLLIPLVRYKFGIYPPEPSSVDFVDSNVQYSKNLELSLRDYFSCHSMSRYKMDFVELELLGKGGYGSVYRVYNRIDECDYALKKITMNTDSKHLQEVRAMAKFSHPNIVRYFCSWIELVDSVIQSDRVEPSFNPYDNPCNDEVSSHDDFSDSFLAESGTCSSRSYLSTASTLSNGTQPFVQKQTAKAVLYIQMELCSRSTLRDWLGESDRNVDLPQCIHIITQLLEGLRYIHSLGFVHRDVTPSNLFVGLDGANNMPSLKIGDMGLTKRSMGNNAHSSTDLDATTGGIFEHQTIGVGTYLYASPEQLTTTTYGSSADMYSVGVILFELLQPFKTQMERVLTLTKLKAGLIATSFSILYPRECGLIQWLLCNDPHQRPTAEHMLYQLSVQ